jgi:putative ABC transport system permease protein
LEFFLTGFYEVWKKMTNYKYIIRSIVHYHKQHLALFLGMAVSAAVLTGALIVGDSIRYSLTNMVNTRLGKTQFAIIGGSRFMDANLAGNLAQALHVPVAPLLMLKGIVIQQDSGTMVNRAGIIGIDSSFNEFGRLPLPVPADDEAVVSENLADRLHVSVGDELLVRVESGNLIPVNAPFAREPAPTVAMRLTIKAVASNDQLGRLNLNNDQSNAFNVFISLGFLGRRLDLAGLSNALLVAGEKDQYSLAAVRDSIQSLWSLKDLGLSVEHHDENGVYDLVSNRIFIDTIVQRIITQEDLPHNEVITYLVNDIVANKRHIPYSFASAVSSSMSGSVLNDNEVLINRWSAEDLDATTGDSLTLSYFEIGPLRELREISRSFIIKDIIDNTDHQIDSTLMPGYQGLSEAGNCSDWDAGVPIDLKRIRDKDEKYWDDYRGTPKVLLSPETGKRIWKNQFGSLTSVRFNESQVTTGRLSSVLLGSIKPSDIGLQVVNVREEGALAAGNAVNFTELFLGMSFFIILAGVLLTTLIYSLHFNRRSSETALLSGLGFSAKRIIRLRFTESSLVIIMGSIAGALLGILYNYALIGGLNSVWNNIVRTDMLEVHISMSGLLLGSVFSIIIAVLPVYIVTSGKLRQPVAKHLTHHIHTPLTLSATRNKSVVRGYMLLFLSFVLVLCSFALDAIDNAAFYLTSAALFLTGSMFLIHGWLRRNSSSSKIAVPAMKILAVKNLQRNPARSLSVIALLAVGTFTIMLTGAYRKTFYGTELLRQSGTGGYILWAETTSPVPFNLNSTEGKSRLITDLMNDLEGVRFLQFDRLEGDDASCLNLNQAQRPQILSVNSAIFDSAGAFSFVRLLPGFSREHPWQGLENAFNDSTFPAFADQNVIQYSLKKKLGDTLIYLNESGKPFRLILSGAIKNSVFQGNILVSDKVFRRQFPSSGGTKTILIDAPAHKLTLIAGILNRSLVDYGIDVTSTSERLATFNSVENTYLTVFMALSGLGFIIGTIGLGIVLLRNIYERRQELALLLSLGYNHEQVFKIVFTENFILLAAGFFTGMLAALVGILPSLLSPSFDMQGGFLILLTAGIFLSGLLWIYFPLKSALNKPLIPALRNE